MTLAEAYKTLGLETGTPETERRRVYDELRETLKQKSANAPTEGLKRKYTEGLTLVDNAIETIESAIDERELPVFSAHHSDPAATSKRSSKRARNSFWTSFASLLTASLIAVVILWMHDYSTIQQLQQEAAQAAETERLVLEAQKAEEIHKQKLNAKLALNRKQAHEALAPLETKLDEALAKLHNLEGAERIALERGETQAIESAQFRREQYDVFVSWLRSYIQQQPATQRLATSKELERSGALSEAIAILEKTDLPSQSDLTNIARSEDSLYNEPVNQYATRKAYAKSATEAATEANEENFGAAIALLSPFATDPVVGDQATAELNEIRQKRVASLFEKAQAKLEAGDTQGAKNILDGIAETLDKSQLSDSQSEIVSTVNSEYSYQQGLRSSEKALDEENGFENARSILRALAGNPKLSDRVAVDLARIDEIEAIEDRKRIELRSLADSTPVEDEESLSIKPDRAPRLLKSEDPEYPESLRNSKLEGFVDITCVIGVDGRPKDLDIISSSHVAFEAPTLAAVRNWRFKPAEKDGIPMELKVRQRIRFTP